jgi:ABC-type nitrate/sulfonate/bicarbonate transport system permease component
MSSLADLPEIVGFFSYSREDDEGTKGGLSALRDAIQRELSAQLGRSKSEFRLWQDAEAIAPGKLWESEIRTAIEQSVFFIPIITPRVVRSRYCKFEFESFLGRESELGRADLVFPILYMTVAALEDEAQWRNDALLSIIGKRQYLDWRAFRHLDVHTPSVREAIERFCSKIVAALDRPVRLVAPAQTDKSAETPAAVALRERQAEDERREEARRAAEARAAQEAQEAQERRRREQAEQLAAERRRAEQAAAEAERRRVAQEAEAERRRKQEDERRAAERRRAQQQEAEAQEAQRRRREQQEAAIEAERRRAAEAASSAVVRDSPSPPFLWRLLKGAVLPVLLLVIWQIAVATTAVNSRFLPAPSTILTAWLTPPEGFLTHLGYTAARFGIGFLIGTGAAIVYLRIGAAAPRTHPLMQPLFRFLYAIPAVAYIPLLTVWLGIGLAPGIAAAAIAAFFPLVWSAAGVAPDTAPRSVPLDPRTLGLPLAAALAFSAALASEFFASNRGLGFLVVEYYQLFNAVGLWSIVPTIGIVAFAIDIAAKPVERLAFRISPGLESEQRRSVDADHSRFDARRPLWYRAAQGAAVPILLLLGWEISGRMGLVSDLLLPSPATVIGALFDLFASGGLAGHLGTTVTRLIAAFVLGLVSALILARALRARLAIAPYILPLFGGLAIFPAVIWIAPISLWLGWGDASKIIAAALAAFFAALSQTAGPTERSRDSSGSAAGALGRSDLLSAAALAFKVAFMVLLVAEYYAGKSGLGFLMMYQVMALFDLFSGLAVILLIGGVGLVFEAVIAQIVLRGFAFVSRRSQTARS